MAKQSYVMEKRLNLTYTRPSYAAFYPKAGGPPQIRPSHHPPWNQPASFNRPVASVKPMITTPVPMKAKEGVSVIPHTKPGVTVHKIITTTDITLPGTSTQSGVSASGGTMMNKIPAGQQVFVIKTPKGVYIRTKEGKIFAVRAKTPLVSGMSSASTTSVTTVTIKNSTATVAPKVTPKVVPKVGAAQPIIVYPKPSAKIIDKKSPRQTKTKVVKPNISKITKKSPDGQSQAEQTSSLSKNSESISNLMDFDLPETDSEKNVDRNVQKQQSEEVSFNGQSTSNSQTDGGSQSVTPIQTESVGENGLKTIINFDRQNSFSSQQSSSDEGHVQFSLSDNNDSQFGSDMGNYDQSDNSNNQVFDFDNPTGERQKGFLETLFDTSDITPFQPARQGNNSFNRVDSTASLTSNVGHIDLRDDSERNRESGNDNMDSFMSHYPRIAPNNMNSNYAPQNTPMSHMFNPMHGFNQPSPQMGYNPMYPYPVLFPPNRSQSNTTDGSSTSQQNNDYMSPLQNMSQMGANPMMGFPFAPYPFPMPSPYMMGNPYMQMGMPPQYGHQGGMQGGMMPPPNSANTNQQENSGQSSQ